MTLKLVKQQIASRLPIAKHFSSLSKVQKLATKENPFMSKKTQKPSQPQQSDEKESFELTESETILITGGTAKEGTLKSYVGLISTEQPKDE